MIHLLFLSLVWLGVYVGLFAALGKVIGPWVHRRSPSRAGAWIAVAFGMVAFTLSYLVLSWALPPLSPPLSPPLAGGAGPDSQGVPWSVVEQVQWQALIKSAAAFVVGTVNGIFVNFASHWLMFGHKERM